MSLRRLLAVVVLFVSAGRSLAQEAAVPAGDKEPYLRLETGGPTSYVTGLAFSPDGNRLYVGSWDKVVRVWTLNAQGRFVLDPAAFRVPIGPGNFGAINALAVSPDGKWLAVGGIGMFNGASGFRQAGRLGSTRIMSPEMLLQVGTIYLFDTQGQQVRLLRGHKGPIHTLAFAPAHPNKPPLLVSAAREQQGEQTPGSVAIWDVTKTEPLARVDGLPDPRNGRPGLAAWHTGNEPLQVRVALALDDGQFRVWDPSQKEAPAAVREPGGDPVRFNHTAVVLPGERILAASERPQSAAQTKGVQLNVWTVSAGEAPKPGAKPLAFFPSDAAAGRFAYPQDLALVSPDLAALVLAGFQREGQGASYKKTHRLVLVDLKTGAPRADRTLWSDSDRLAIVAAAPNGKTVAVAGSNDHEILVFPVDGLLKQKVEPQRIRTAGAAVRYASFAIRDKDLSLVVSEAPKAEAGQRPREPRDGDLIFDFSQRHFLGDRRGWRLDTPAPGAWRVQRSADKTPRGEQVVLTVFQGNQAAGPAIRLSPGVVVNDYALLPPTAPFNEPFLAVAAQELGNQLLNLYRVRTGDQLRQYSGHEGQIVSVAFSGDGRFLVSAGEDRTVRVWTLTDLDQILGKRGLVKGLRLRTEKQQAAVESVGTGPLQGKLNPGEIVVGIVEQGKVRPTASAQDFHDAIDRMKPGADVTLRIKGKDAERDVAVRVGQRIDDQKPLFSLFLTTGPRPELREWIGWNPIGPYEASTPRAERHLGWHINTGDAKMPARFAAADVYRKQYYREGILKALMAAGDISKVPPPPPPPAPRLGLFIEDAGKLAEFDKQEQVVVRRPKVALKLEATGDHLDIVQSAAWQLDDAAEQVLAPNPDGTLAWSQPLELARGLHTVRFRVHTNEAQPRTFAQELVVRYQPPPPQLVYQGEAQPVVREAKFELPFQVAGVLPEEVSVRIRQRHNGKDVLNETKSYTLDPAKPQDVKPTIQLLPGYNQVEVIAQNKSASAGDETSRFGVEITYVEKATPPEIALQSVVPVGNGHAQSVKPLETIFVQSPRVRIVGAVKATESLTRAEFLAGDKPQRLAGFDPKKKDIALAQEVSLQPGRNRFVFRAQTESSPEARRELEIDYQPPTPTVVIQEPRSGQFLYGEQPMHIAPLRCQLQPTGDKQPFTAQVWLNGKELPTPPKIDEKAQTLTAELSLRPGENTVQVLLRNAWGARFTSEKIDVGYARPPKIEKLETVPGQNRSFVDVVARVRSPLRLLRESIDLRVNEQRRRVDLDLPDKPENGNLWVVRFKQVPLDGAHKENSIVVRVGNTEAACVEPARVEVVRVPVPPPVLEFLEPREKCNVHEPDLTVRLHIESEQPLRTLQLVQEGRPPVDLDPKKLQAAAGGRLVLDEKQTLHLGQGVNALRLEAVYEGGEHRSQNLLVNYLPRRTEILVDTLELREPGQGPRKVLDTGGKASFEPVQHGHVRLHGRVRWGDEVDAAKRKRWQRVRLYVNGFQQRWSPLNLVTKDESEFTADLLLNQPDNRLVLSVNEQDAGQRQEFQVHCGQPVDGKRLHLVLMSLTDESEETLKARFMKALEAKLAEQGLPRTPAFAEVHVYRPLTGDKVRPETINYLLAFVSNTVRGIAGAGDFGNDVVVLYYQGDELVSEKGNSFQTALSKLRPNASAYAVPCDRLVEFFADTPGAHMLLLDVDRKLSRGPDRITDWQDNFPDARAHVVLLRYAWMGKELPSADARLLTALERAMPQSSKLVDVTVLTQKFAERLRDLAYNDYLPPGLGDLRVGGVR